MRRRVAALVILLVVVALLVWGLSAFARSGKTDETEATPETVAEAPSTTLATEPTVQLSEESTTSSAEPTEPTEPSEETAAAPVKKGSCELADLQIHASSNQPSYAIGVQPVFSMEVENPTDADCVIDLDDNLLRFEVYKMADNERVWSDTDCYASVQTGSQTFPAGKDVKFEAEWSRQASKPGECTNRPTAEPGAYFAHTIIGDNSSPPQDFTLR